MFDQARSRLEDFEEHWTSTPGHYVLVGPRSPGFLIFDMKVRMAVVIEDDRLAAEVTKKMLQAGVPVVDARELPEWRP